MRRQVAQAPRLHHASLRPMAELQRDQALLPAGEAASGGVDLSLLTACLCPSDQARR